MKRFPFAVAPLKMEGTSTAFDTEASVSEAPEPDEDQITLSTGTSFYANLGIVGIGPDGRVTEGYDGGVDTHHLSPLERQELSALMIERWQKFASTP